MGTRALRVPPFVQEGGPDVDRLRRRKCELLAWAHDVVAVSLPDMEGLAAAADEAAEMVARATALPLEAGRPALEAAAVLVPEDLVVLLRRDGAWRMAAGVVCFPSHWSPGAKLGRSVADIHGPVPRYAEELRNRVDHFLDHLTPDRPVWRRNWGVHASPELYAPLPVPVPGPVAPEDHWLRSERQTLTALPHTGAILFTIRTEQFPLASLQHQPDFASRLAAAICATPGDLVRYRFGDIDTDGIVRWLERTSRS
jgi:hypothetical protein